jgi:hypothetical protein
MMKLMKMLSLLVGTTFVLNLPTVVLAELGSAIRKITAAVVQGIVDLQTAGITLDSGFTGLLLFLISQFLMWRIRRGARAVRAQVCMLAVAVASMGLLTGCSCKPAANQPAHLSGKRTSPVGTIFHYAARIIPLVLNLQ